MAARAGRTSSTGGSDAVWNTLSLRLYDGRLRATGTTMDASVIVDRHAGALGDVDVVIPRGAVDVVRAMPPEDISIGVESAALALRAGSSTMRVPRVVTMPTYPTIPAPDHDAPGFVVSNDLFRFMAQATVGFVDGGKVPRASMAGVILSGRGYFGATDTHVFSVVDCADVPEEIGDVLMMPAHVALVAQIARDERDDVRIRVGRDVVEFGTGGVRLVGRRISADEVAPIWRVRELALKSSSWCTVERTALLGALERVVPLAANNEAWLVFARDAAHVVTIQPFGKSRVSVPAGWDGLDMAVFLNPAYLSQLISAVRTAEDSDTVRIGSSGPLSPLVVIGDDGCVVGMALKRPDGLNAGLGVASIMEGT